MRRAIPAILLGALGLLALAYLVGGRPGPRGAAPALPVAAVVEEHASAEVEALSVAEPATSTERVAEPAPERAVEEPTPEPSERQLPALVVRVVKKGTREPIAGARVWIMEEHDDGRFVGIGEGELTDADGVARVAVAPETDLEVWVRGGSDDVGDMHFDTDPLRAHEEREILVELAAGKDRLFFGRVLDDASGAPIADAEIVSLETGTSSSREQSPHKGRAVATTDAGGEFVLESVTWKNEAGFVRAAGYGILAFGVTGGHDSPISPRELRVKRVATVRASVVDARSGPRSGVELRLTAHAYQLTDARDGFVRAAGFVWKARTGDDGTCTLEDVPPGVPLAVELRGRDLERKEPKELLLEPDEVRELSFTLSGGATIRGLALDQSGAPVKDEAVVLVGKVDFGRADRVPVLLTWSDTRNAVAETKTDREGRFELEDVPAGEWWVGLSSAGAIRRGGPGEDAIAPLAVPVDVREGDAVVEVTIRAHRGLFIRGKVVDADGNPERTYVAAHGLDVAGMVDVQQMEVKKDGSFALGPLEPGRYSVSAHGTPPLAGSDAVEARAGDEGVVIVLRRGCTLSGTVLFAGAAGTPTKLYLSPSDGALLGVRLGEVAPDGRFEIAGILPGTYALAAAARDGTFGLVRGLVADPQAPLEDLRIPMAAGARLAMHFAGPEEYVQVRASAEGALVFIDGIRSGTDAAAVVPASRVTLTWSTRERRTGTLELDLAPGETRAVALAE